MFVVPRLHVWENRDDPPITPSRLGDPGGFACAVGRTLARRVTPRLGGVRGWQSEDGEWGHAASRSRDAGLLTVQPALVPGSI